MTEHNGRNRDFGERRGSTGGFSGRTGGSGSWNNGKNRGGGRFEERRGGDREGSDREGSKRGGSERGFNGRSAHERGGDKRGFNSRGAEGRGGFRGGNDRGSNDRGRSERGGYERSGYDRSGNERGGYEGRGQGSRERSFEGRGSSSGRSFGDRREGARNAGGGRDGQRNAGQRNFGSRGRWQREDTEPRQPLADKRGRRQSEETLRGDLRSANRGDRARSPEIDEDVTGRELDRVTSAQVRNLDERNAEWVAKHLVMADRLLDVDPELAFEHTLAASRRGGRLAVVREAAGIAAYRAGHFSDALRELRTHRRISGVNTHLPLIADSERGVGRPEKALETARSEEAGTLDAAGQVEMSMVASGAHADMGDPAAALRALETRYLVRDKAFSYSPRLFRAYAEALERAGRSEEARDWERLAYRADEALGTGDFAEPEIVDIAPEDEAPERPRTRSEATGTTKAPDSPNTSGAAPQARETETVHAAPEDTPEVTPAAAPEPQQTTTEQPATEGSTTVSNTENIPAPGHESENEHILGAPEDITETQIVATDTDAPVLDLDEADAQTLDESDTEEAWEASVNTEDGDGVVVEEGTDVEAD